MPDRPNILVIVSDTLRSAHLGCYGNTTVSTPHIDAFAERAVRFTEAYPESLPTIPVRRALHTGRRAYPFADWTPVPWDIVYLPGWQAMDRTEDTLAEHLAARGYQTGFVTDTLPYFAPGFNFQRGFWQWEYIRGQQQDRWRSPYSVGDDRLGRYGDVDQLHRDIHGLVPMHLANTADWHDETDTSTARTFAWAMRFLEDNVEGQPFYLMVDCFDPHEPWEAPEQYYNMYGPDNYTGRRIVHCGYGPADKLGYTDEEIRYVEAQYCGLVSLVDAWFGKLMEKLESLGLFETTAIFFLSDHGTNFCDNPRNIIGKPSDAMYHGVMNLPMLVRLPGQTANGTTCNQLVYNIDVSATVAELAGLNKLPVDGQPLDGLVLGHADQWTSRDYVTCRYGNDVVTISHDHWVLADVEGRCGEIFDRGKDPMCTRDVSGEVGREVFETAWQRLLKDADGSFVQYDRSKHTDAIGQTGY